MKPGAVVVAIAVVVSACAGFGGSATPDLYAVCWHSVDAAAADFLMERGWSRPQDQDTAFFVPLDGAPLVSWEPVGDDPEAAAVIERLGMDRPQLARDYKRWVVLSRSDDQMLLGGIGSQDGLGALLYAKATDEGDWTRRFARQIRCGVRAAGLDHWTDAPWQLDPQVEPLASDSELAIRFYEGCPDDLADWEIVPIVFTNDEAVMITITATPPPGAEAQYCNLGAATSWRNATVDIGEPIGDRILLDGSSFPMQPRPWPPSPLGT